MVHLIPKSFPDLATIRPLPFLALFLLVSPSPIQQLLFLYFSPTPFRHHFPYFSTSPLPSNCTSIHFRLSFTYTTAFFCKTFLLHTEHCIPFPVDFSPITHTYHLITIASDFQLAVFFPSSHFPSQHLIPSQLFPFFKPQRSSFFEYPHSLNTTPNKGSYMPSLRLSHPSSSQKLYLILASHLKPVTSTKIFLP